jgi:hypothetical protein
VNPPTVNPVGAFWDWALLAYDFSEREMLVIVAVKLFSVSNPAHRQMQAQFPKLCQLARQARIAENKLIGVVLRLVSKKVLHVFDEDGRPVAGKAIARRGHWYGLLEDVTFWDVRPRVALTPELEKERAWLMGLHAVDIEPKQPPLLAKGSSLGDTLQQNAGRRAQENISPTPGAASKEASAGRLNRSEPVRDAGLGATGGTYRESVGSVPGDLAMPAAGFTAPPPSAFEPESPAAASTETERPQWARELAALKESLGEGSTHTQQADLANLPKREDPPKKGGFFSQKGRFDEPAGAGSDETSQKGRFLNCPGTIGQSGDSPKKGGLPTVRQYCPTVLLHSKDSETVTAGRPRVVTEAEMEFMRRYRALCGDPGEEFLRFWRRRYRSVEHRELVECILDRAEIRKKSPAMEPLRNPAKWMWAEYYDRGLALFGLKDLPRKAEV